MIELEDVDVVSFVAEWFDLLPQLVKKFLLKYYHKSNEAEMIDLASKRLFLKRSPCLKVKSLKDFRINCKVNIYGRYLLLVAYGDETTRSVLEPVLVETIVVVPPILYKDTGKVIQEFTAHQLTLSNIQMFELGEMEANNIASFFSSDENEISYFTLLKGPLVVIKLFGKDSMNEVEKIAKFISEGEYESGTILCPTTKEEVCALDKYFFGKDSPFTTSTASFDNCTCCIIKPHAIIDGNAGKIIDHIFNKGYEISAMKAFHLDNVKASEFFEVYNGVLPEYRELIGHMTSSVCIVLEVRAENAVNAFRATVGPWDIGMAKELKPSTIRALYGIDYVKSAVHCTELKQLAISDCQYFFRYLFNTR
mmetsp:Transcript_1113/g.1703  ORF Transcript_1113/g.1703 Transcript_1113/m.1703 type:complete len:365 (-) Transcript_1113:19-1113(-)